VLRHAESKSNRFRRDAWLEVNLSNLEFNLKKLYSEFQKPLIPVLKADAYGHGADVLLELLDSYDFIYAYAVASIDEALNLREWTKRKIIVLGITPQWALKTAIDNDIDITIADYTTAFEYNHLAFEQKKIANIHLKIDTGMNRIGFKSANDLEKLIALENLEIDTAYTHMASANDDFTLEQETLFYSLIQSYDFKIHPAASAAARNLKNQNYDFVRVGIELYGQENLDLKPLLSLFARVSFVKDIKAQESVSYSRTWFAQEDTKIITLPLGYADGVHRLMSNKIKAYYKGTLLEQVGTITMDQMMFACPQSLDIKVGDLVELFGENIAIGSWAQAAQTISYEIVTSLNLRLPKTYKR
jgi:alanine racemase